MRSSLPKNQQNQHIQTCLRWEMANRLGCLQSDIHYCYQCFDWVVGAEWEAHCQAHLAELTSKQCGTVTYCHTLVRPGYCLFCMGNPELPASQRLRPWSRDHKLWVHIEEEHLIGCQWPLLCLHPLCDTLQKDSTSLQFHLMDDHGLSRARPGKAAASSLHPSADEVPVDEEADGARACRKRKSPSGSGALKWMPSQSCSAPPGELYRPPTRQQQAPSTISPQLILPDDDMSYNQIGHTTMDLDLLSPFSASIDDDDMPIDVDDAMLFDQYLRSPSPSRPLSPEDTASEFSGVTLIETKVDRYCRGKELDTAKSPCFAPEDVQRGEIVRDRDDRHDTTTCPRVRLRVSQPKVMLRLKLRNANQLGKKKKETRKRSKRKGKNRKTQR